MTTFQLKEKVEAHYFGMDASNKPWNAWISAKIISVNLDGTYDIRYNDDEVERNKKPIRIRKVVMSLYIFIVCVFIMLHVLLSLIYLKKQRKPSVKQKGAVATVVEDGFTFGRLHCLHSYCFLFA